MATRQEILVQATRGWAALILTLMAFVIPTSSQETSEAHDRLYSSALVAGVDQMRKQWGYIDDGDRGSRIRTDYHHLIVRKNPEITDDLPSQSDEFHFEYLDDAALHARYRKLKKPFSVLEVHPIHDRGSTLKIHIAQSWVESQQGRIVIAISDWANVDFRYDCKQQAYVISDVRLGGI